MIRKCEQSDVETVCAIINDAAQAYKGVIPADCWHEPYLPLAELLKEIGAGVEFWGWEQDGCLVGVMGIQDRGEVTLIRHAYVRTQVRNQGIGTRLLRHLEGLTAKPILVGTWTDAAWAIAFYQKNGYERTSPIQTCQLLKEYWSIPERQIETSVVLRHQSLG
jgi:GNAT superfamily N-acetyltransferase